MTEKVKRGDIFYADLNPATGSEISKIRPVLVVSNDLNNEYADTVTIIPIATAKRTKIYPFEVLLKASELKLQNDSIAKANQVRTIDKRRLRNKISSADNFLLADIEQALCIHLDIETSAK